MCCDNRVGLGIKLDDSNIVGRSSSAMASALAFGEFTRNGDIIGSVMSTFKVVCSLESASTAYLGTGKDMTVLGRVGKVINTIEFCFKMVFERGNLMLVYQTDTEES